MEVSRPADSGGFARVAVDCERWKYFARFAGPGQVLHVHTQTCFCKLTNAVGSWGGEENNYRAAETFKALNNLTNGTLIEFPLTVESGFNATDPAELDGVPESEDSVPPDSQEYEDGTNIPLGTTFYEEMTVSEDWYSPSQSTARTTWKNDWQGILQRFENLLDQYRPIECLLIQTPIPRLGVTSGYEWMMHGRDICQSGSGLSRDMSRLVDPNRAQLFGEFVFPDAQDVAICNTAGEPFGIRLGLSRQMILFSGPNASSETRPEPGPRLFELCSDATQLLYELPPATATKIWCNWLCGFPRGSNSDGYLWLNALFELAWQRPKGAPFHASRFAWDDYLKVELDGSGLFPRLPSSGPSLPLPKIPNVFGYTNGLCSELNDVARASIAAIRDILDFDATQHAIQETPGTSEGASQPEGSTPKNLIPRKQPSTRSHRFHVALSFPGEHRPFVLDVAEALAEKLTRDRVFYDEWYEVELLGVGGDLKLQAMYTQADLVVPFFSKHYSKKWCSMEWETIRGILLDRRSDDAVIPVHLDDTDIPGWSAVNFGIRLQGRTPQQVADIILQALAMRIPDAATTTSPTTASPTTPDSPTVAATATPTSSTPHAANALAIWQEKLDYLQQQAAIAAAPAQKFALKKLIEEAQRKIRELG